jgi:hypothetical protein
MPKATDYPNYPQFEGLNLKPEHQEFVILYCYDLRFNVTRAYIEAVAKDKDMKPDVAAVCGCQLLKEPKVKKAVEIEMERKLSDRDYLAKRIIEEHSSIAFALIDMVHDGVSTFGYTVKSMDEVPKNYRAAIRGFKKTGDGLLEVMFYDKQKSLDSLSRMLGMFDDNSRRVGEKYEDMIQEMRKRRGDDVTAG